MSYWGHQFHDFLFNVSFVQHYHFSDEIFLLIPIKCGTLQFSFGLSFSMKWHVTEIIKICKAPFWRMLYNWSSLNLPLER